MPEERAEGCRFIFQLARSEDDRPEPASKKTANDDEDDEADVDEMEEFGPASTPAIKPVPSALVSNPPTGEQEIPGAVIGAKVHHKILGDGEIVGITSKGQKTRYITCMLRGTKRKFIYPDIFIDGRLELINS